MEREWLDQIFTAFKLPQLLCIINMHNVKIQNNQPAMVAHTCKPSTLEEEVHTCFRLAWATWKTGVSKIQINIINMKSSFIPQISRHFGWSYGI